MINELKDFQFSLLNVEIQISNINSSDYYWFTEKTIDLMVNDNRFIRNT